MSIHILSSSKNETGLAIGNNGQGYRLIYPVLATVPGRLLDFSKSPRIFASLEACARGMKGNSGASVRINHSNICSQLDDAIFLQAAFSGVRTLSGLGVIGLGARSLTPLPMAINTNEIIINFFKSLFGRSARKKVAKNFTSTGTFVGDLEHVLTKPEEYLQDSLVNFIVEYAGTTPLLEAAKFGMFIADKLNYELSFEGICANMKLTLPQIQELDRANKENKLFDHLDIRKMTSRELDMVTGYTNLTPKPEFVKNGLAVFSRLTVSIKKYIVSRLVFTAGGAIAQRLFPGGTTLLNSPKSPQEWLNDLGRVVINDITEMADNVIQMKI